MNDSIENRSVISFSLRKDAIAAKKLAADPMQKFQRQIEVYTAHKAVSQKAREFVLARGKMPENFERGTKLSLDINDDSSWSIDEAYPLQMISWIGDLLALDFFSADDALVCLKYGQIKLQFNDEKKTVIMPFTDVAEIPYTAHYIGLSTVKLEVPQLKPGSQIQLILRDLSQRRLMSRSIVI